MIIFPEGVWNKTADDAWDAYLAIHTGCVPYYGRKIEQQADYHPKHILRPEDVWQSVAEIQNLRPKNIAHVRYARQLIAREQRRDFQRRF